MHIPTLPQGQEFEALRVLSEGLVQLLHETDAVFLDTSFVVNGVGSFNDYNSRELMKYRRSGSTGKGCLDLRCLQKLYREWELGQNTKISLDEINDLVDENLLRSDILLTTLEGMVTEHPIFLPSVAFYEVEETYRVAKRSLERFHSSHTHKSYRKGFRANRKVKRDGQTHETARRELFDKYKGSIDTSSLARNLKGNLTKLSQLLTLFESQGRITSHSRIFPTAREYHDHLIIDSATDHPVERVGIATNDSDFLVKIPEVRAERERRGLRVPTTFLVLGSVDMEGYDRNRLLTPYI